MTPSLTVHTERRQRASGYLLVEADRDDHQGDGRRFVPVHRLAAVAWGHLDSLAQPLDVHHRDGCPVHNAEGNLAALDPREHGRVTRQQARDRQEGSA